MVAQVIELNNQTRCVARDARSESELAGFQKALATVYSLHGSSMTESKSAIENWHAAELLSRGERAALYKFFGWAE